MLTTEQFDSMDVSLESLVYECNESGNETATGVFRITACCCPDDCPDLDDGINDTIRFSPAAMASHPDLPQKGDPYSRPFSPVYGYNGTDPCTDPNDPNCTRCGYVDDMGNFEIEDAFGNPLQCQNNGILVYEFTGEHPVDDIDRPAMEVTNVSVGGLVTGVDALESDAAIYGKSVQCSYRDITVTWGIPEAQQPANATPPNETSCNPLDWCSYPVWSEVRTRKAVTKAEFGGFYTTQVTANCCQPNTLTGGLSLTECNGMNRVMPGECLLPQTSAGIPINNFSQEVVTGRLTLDVYNPLDNFNPVDLDYPFSQVGKCNVAQIQIRIPCANVRYTFPARTLRLYSATHSIVPYVCNGFRSTYLKGKIVFDYDQTGHDTFVPNFDSNYKVCPGGNGNLGDTLFPTDLTDSKFNEGDILDAKDKNGQPTKVWLDRDGSPMTDQTQQTFLQYRCCAISFAGGFGANALLYDTPAVEIL